MTTGAIVLLILLGIVIAYHAKGVHIGNLFLGGTFLLSVITIVVAFRTKTWKRLGLVGEINGKITPFEEEKIKVGDTGKTITRLNPIGKVQVNDIICEAKSTGSFIEENKEIEVIKVLKTQIVVKLK